METVFTRQEVPSQGVVSFEEEIWKPIPGASNYEAGSLGNIRKRNGEVLKKYDAHTTKGYYHNVSVRIDYGTTLTTGVHRFICTAFHPLPADADVLKYEPNHIDGNKLNNRADNLEWMTRSRNVLHAFETGLCQVGVRIEARNIKTGLVRNYNSLSAAAREFNIPRSQLRSIIARHREIPYDNQWLFKLDDASDKKLLRHQAIDVIVKDYVSGSISIYRDAASASVATGVRQSTVNLHVSPYSPIKEKGRLLAGYVFKSLSDKITFPEYGVEEATESRRRYMTGAKKLEVIDTHLNTTKVYKKCDFAKEIGKNADAFKWPIEKGSLYLNRYKLREV